LLKENDFAAKEARCFQPLPAVKKAVVLLQTEAKKLPLLVGQRLRAVLHFPYLLVLQEW